MSTTAKLTTIAVLSLLFTAPDAAAQWFPRRPRPPRVVPQDLRPGVGVLLGPTSRDSETNTGGFELALTGEIPVLNGYRGRAELGASTWATDPATERSATRLTVTRATLGLYQVSGDDGLHAFIGGGVGLYRFRVEGAAGSGTKPGAFGGVGMEAAGRRRAVSLELRVTFAGGQRANESVHDPHDTVLHASLLFGVKRLF